MFVNLAVLRLNLALDSATAAALEAPRRERDARVRALAPARLAAHPVARPRSSVGLVDAGPAVYIDLSADVSAREKEANRRIRLLLGVFVLLFAASSRARRGCRSSRPRTLATLAQSQHRETQKTPAGRGTIFDRTGVAARDRRADDDGLRRPAAGARTPPRSRARRTQSLGVDANALYPQLLDKKSQLRLRRSGSPTREGGEARAEGPRGLGFYPEERRTYPQGRVGAQVVGYAGVDNKGLAGLEVEYDQQARRAPGQQTIVRDPFGHAIDVISSAPEQKGADVFTTIDHTIQAHAEAVLRADRVEVGREGRDRDRARPEDGRGARDGAGARLRREQRVERVRSRCSATAPSPTRTSPARRSSSSRSTGALSEGSSRRTTTFTLPYSIRGRRPRRSTTPSSAAPRR